jgi:ABC-2 type transport system permease protein
VNLFGVLGQSQLYLSPFEVLGMLPIYALWALPTIGWLMMVSAWARTKPFLWAVGVPVLSGTLLTWFNAIFGFDWNIGWFWHHIVGRGLLSAFPGSWFTHPASEMGETVIRSAGGMSIHEQGGNMGALMMQSWNMLATADLWIGVAIGVTMIFVATRLRRWRDEG